MRFSFAFFEVKTRNGDFAPTETQASQYNRTNTMSRKKTLFGIGMVLYAISFALVAVADRWPGHGSLRGYATAVCSIWFTLGLNPLSNNSPFRDLKFEYVSLLISGLINPLFLVILILAARGYQRTIAVLRIVLLLMIPFSWVVFHWQDFYPREGYFLWLIGIVLVLFCGFLGSESLRDWEECPWCSGKDQNCLRCSGTGWILVRDQPKLRREIKAQGNSSNG
jgi:hypothetical protein